MKLSSSQAGRNPLQLVKQSCFACIRQAENEHFELFFRAKKLPPYVGDKISHFAIFLNFFQVLI